MNDKTHAVAAVPSAAVERFHHVSGDVEANRAAREVETSMLVAKRFPRDEIRAREKIGMLCARPALAEEAAYSYRRGSEVVEGPSIRLAEAIAQAWGNLEFGTVELSQGDGQSSVRAFAWDIENNTRQSRTFVVPHVRYSKAGGRADLGAGDPRDVYEAVMNQAARRLRACILGVIPKDVVDEAVSQCEATLRNTGGAPAEQLKQLIDAFKAMGVGQEMIGKRLGHKLEATSIAEIVRLRRVYAALRDGMTTVEAEFGGLAAPQATSAPPAASAPRQTTTVEPEAGDQVEGQAEAPPDVPPAAAPAPADTPVGRGVIKSLRNGMVSAKIEEKEFCHAFGVQSLEQLPASKAKAATAWIVENSNA